MSCGFGEHVWMYSFYNSYDDADVFECSRCGKIKSRNASPLYKHAVTSKCCGVPRDWFSKDETSLWNVGDPWDCQLHGTSVVTKITTEQVRGKRRPTKAAQPENHEEPSTTDVTIGGLVVLVLLAALLAGCIAIIR